MPKHSWITVSSHRGSNTTTTNYFPFLSVHAPIIPRPFPDSSGHVYCCFTFHAPLTAILYQTKHTILDSCLSLSLSLLSIQTYNVEKHELADRESLCRLVDWFIRCLNFMSGQRLMHRCETPIGTSHSSSSALPSSVLHFRRYCQASRLWLNYNTELNRVKS